MNRGFTTPRNVEEESGRGQPRTQYARTYVLLPPGTQYAWASAVVEAFWDDRRYTFGGSADDAGIGDLDERRVIVVNPSWWVGDIFGFFLEYYPGVVVDRVSAETPAELVKALRILEGLPLVDDGGAVPGEFPQRGLHDLSGGYWLATNGGGWCTEAVYLDGGPRKLDGLEYLRDNGVRVILNLRYGYATDDGGQGTIAPTWRLEQFESAVIETMHLNPAAWGFVYCNEANNPREWPENQTVMPPYYLASYNRVWARKPQGARLSPMAIDPYNAAGWGDWRTTWGGMLANLLGADFVALHAYTHGGDPALVWGYRQFEDWPLEGIYYDLRVLESQRAILPDKFAELPVVVTETNPDADGMTGWRDDFAPWVRAAYEYFSAQRIAGACLFRHNHDRWRCGDKPAIMEALRAV